MVWFDLYRAYQKVALVLDHGILSKTSLDPINWRASSACTCDDPKQNVCIKHFDIRRLRSLEHREDWPH